MNGWVETTMALMVFLSKRETRSRCQYLQTPKLRQIDHHVTFSEKGGRKLSWFFSLPLPSSLSHPSPIFFFFSFLILNQGILAEWTSGSNKALENFIFIWCHCDTWLYSRIRCEMAIYHHPSKQECQEVISLVLSNLI